MSDATPTSETPAKAEPQAETPERVPAPWSIDLPDMTTPLPPDEAMASARKMAMAGNLAGYEKTEGGFSADAFGSIYDRTLHATVKPEGGGSRFTFRATLNKRWPVSVIVVYLFTLWPGVWFTDSLLATWFGWYRLSIWWTSAWYIPLTLLALPYLWKQFKASETASWIHAHEVIDRLGERLDGEVHPVKY